ncbi:ribonuclease E inhibitor RraB [Idiomarina ramblicola]|uniref:Regulator of ribonuclease activity B n=1 Tax=Idiomarina ramblicola TaxID=263724 RepID=A0A432YT63_9GAMM|nr:ribonuclease E inhibitor RraB [Idiomarina ramblicola]RUO64837.1 ribonuclease E inhibitor RraB [Idiomarina ramblicola]
MSRDLNDLLKQSEETVQALMADGAETELLYEIEHHLASQDFTKLEKAAVELVKQGYHVDDADEFEDDRGKRWFAFMAVTDAELDNDILNRQVREIAAIADECEVEYDGWGTLIEDDELEGEEFDDGEE